ALRPHARHQPRRPAPGAGEDGRAARHGERPPEVHRRLANGLDGRGTPGRWSRRFRGEATVGGGSKRSPSPLYAGERAGVRGGLPTRSPTKPLTLTLSPEYRGRG